MKTILLKITAVGFSLFMLGGCIAAAVTGAAVGGGAGVAYVTGTLKADIQATPPQIAEATKRAFAVYDIEAREYRTTNLDAIIKGNTATDKQISVNIKRKNELVSELSIKVGMFGEQAFSQLLYEEIKRQLVQGINR